MSQNGVELPRRRLTTPRAAAVAGIVFAVFYTTSQVLIRLSVPEGIADKGASLASQSRVITLALSLVPFAGIAFLWFMGVIRDRFGKHEDQLFATVFIGSGLLYLGLIFVAAALAGGLMANYAADPASVGSPVYTFSRLVMHQVTNIYALRMAGVLMTSLATMWFRTGVMARWVALITYVLAIGLLVSVSLSFWFSLIFPAWVFVISVYILILNYRREKRGESVVDSALDS